VDTWELAARESIRDLVAQYVHAADRGRFSEVADLFTNDGVLTLTDGRAASGRQAILAFLRGTGTTFRGTMAAPWIRHHVSSHRIVVHASDDAEGFAYFFVVTERGPDHWGRYHDRYRPLDGTWRFASRRVRLDGCAPGSWVAPRRS
jgi:ketosteroid isomerase-like protein